MKSTTKNKQTEDRIRQIIQRSFGTTLVKEEVKVKELTEGYYNVAYELTLPDENVILKIAPPKDLKVMSYEKDIMKAEVNALKLIEEKTSVPVPKVIYYDDTHSICDADYFIMEKIMGESFHQLKCNGYSQEKQDIILREIGRYNKQMNEIIGTSFGYIGQKDKQGKNWKKVFMGMISDILCDGERIGMSLGVTYEDVRNLVSKSSYVLEEVKEPRFIHWDLWEGNVFAKDDKVSGIIDFERALWGDPLMEYYFRAHSYNENFVKGYGEDIRNETPVRALLYDIYLYLIMVIETKYRNYPDDRQYHFATKQLKIAMNKLYEIEL